MSELKREFLKPSNPKVAVRKPDGKHLAVDGEWITVSNNPNYWHKRKTEKSVEVAEAPAKAPAKTKQVTEKE